MNIRTLALLGGLPFLSTGSSCSYLQDYVFSVQQQGREQPEEIKVTAVGNITDIQTNGYDFSLEVFLENKQTLVELGAYWCEPCKEWKEIFTAEGEEHPDWNFISVDFYFPSKEGEIKSPAAERYLGNKAMPTFLVYDQQKQLKGNLAAKSCKEKLAEEIARTSEGYLTLSELLYCAEEILK